MEIVRKLLTAEQIGSTSVRYNPTTDTVQTLVGGTWVDTPEADPRTNPAGQLPARGAEGSTTRCDAAANMTAKVKAVVDMRIAEGGQLALVLLILQFVTLFLPAIGLVAEVLWALTDALLFFSASALSDAFTSTVYDDIQCAFYCDADASGFITASGIAHVYEVINASHPGTVYNVFTNIVSALGVVGINNAGATGEETGDCDSCTDCTWCYTFDFSIDDGGFTARGGYAVYGAGAWRSGAYDANNQVCSIVRHLASPVTITQIVAECFADPEGGSGCRGIFLDATGSYPSGYCNQYNTTGVGATTMTHTETYTTSDFGANFDCAMGGHSAISRMTVRGLGVNPFGEDNC